MKNYHTISGSTRDRENCKNILTQSKVTRNTEYQRKAYDLPSTAALIQYLHATAGSPAQQTWVQAIKAGNFRTWPGLTSANASGYCPNNAEATTLGHMTQTQKGLCSTKATSDDKACNNAYAAACAATYATKEEYNAAYTAAP